MLVNHEADPARSRTGAEGKRLGFNHGEECALSKQAKKASLLSDEARLRSSTRGNGRRRRRGLLSFTVNPVSQSQQCKSTRYHSLSAELTPLRASRAPITDMFLMSLSNSLGLLAVIFIVLFQFIEVNAKREAEAVARINAQVNAL
jgi:hypothetical protein